MPSGALDIAVIGGGIIGLATGLELTARYGGAAVAVLEKERAVGLHQSGHNSGVVHSGIYYRPGSVKAKMAGQGARLIQEFCQQYGLPFARCGKVVVARDASQVPALEELERRGRANGVPDLALIGPERLRELEPYAAGVRALHVPSAATVDYSAITAQYQEIFTRRGGQVRLQCAVTGIALGPSGLRLRTSRGEVRARYAINCAGLFADRISALAGARPGLRIVPFRGEYYELRPSRRHLVRGLIYPVPDPAFPFLGVYLTRRLDGSVEAGPNAVPALKREGYRRRDIDLRDTLDTLSYPGFWHLARRYWRTGLAEIHRSARRSAFVEALRRLVPALEAGDIRRAGAGVRAQALDPHGALLDDFRIAESERMIHVLNAPSPGATTSLCIGAAIADRAAAWLGPASASA